VETKLWSCGCSPRQPTAQPVKSLRTGVQATPQQPGLRSADRVAALAIPVLGRFRKELPFTAANSTPFAVPLGCLLLCLRLSAIPELSRSGHDQAGQPPTAAHHDQLRLSGIVLGQRFSHTGAEARRQPGWPGGPVGNVCRSASQAADTMTLTLQKLDALGHG
jgi:hypothetical protein